MSINIRHIVLNNKTNLDKYLTIKKYTVFYNYNKYGTYYSSIKAVRIARQLIVDSYESLPNYRYMLENLKLKKVYVWISSTSLKSVGILVNETYNFRQ